jgi:predicted nucleotidyltransferase
MKVRIYNKNLNPKFWTPQKALKAEIRTALVEIARQFISTAEINVHIKDILFIGSSANYNWTEFSDIDLHILIDISELDASREIADKLVKLLAKKWNQEHNIKIKGHNVEVYVQDFNEKNASTGVYSLTGNRWINEAEPKKIVLDKNLIRQKYESWKVRIHDAIRSRDLTKTKQMMKDLVNVRNVGLKSEGEFSTENLVFKILRQSGLIGQIKSSIQGMENKALSVTDIVRP